MAGLPPTTASSFGNMLNEKSVSKKPLDEEDMPQEHKPLERGVRSSKAGKSKSTFANMLSQPKQKENY